VNTDVDFELSILGGAVERRWRRARPEIVDMPWSSLDPAGLDPKLVARGRMFWTTAAFQEHRTAAACAAPLEQLVAARAPVDLIALAARFVTDELAHVELCARVAVQLGGGAPLFHDPAALRPRIDPTLAPLLACAELVVRVFCVGEAFSVPMQRATARDEAHPLLRKVIRRIAKDEAAHGAFGWLFFDWALEEVDARARVHLRRAAADSIARIEQILAAPPGTGGARLGWLPSDVYATEARAALARDVADPLRARGLLE
jgi:hypothetical protein